MQVENTTKNTMLIVSGRLRNFLSNRSGTIATVFFIAIAAVALAYGAHKTTRFSRWLVDDAYILFRYAENLAGHGELTWNVGEDPVEGYTGLTLTLLIALAAKLGIAPALASHTIGIFAFFAGGVLLILILKGFNIGSSVAAALYFTAPLMLAHAWSGLETTLFTASILLAVYAYTLHRDRFFLAALFLVGFTRPEGAVLALFLLLFYRPFSWRNVAVFLVPCAVYFAWRWAYYGQLMPNTFYAKRESTKLIVAINAHKLREFARIYLAFPAILAVLFIEWRSLRKWGHLILALAGFAAVVIPNYLPFKLMMDFSHRFYAPFYPLGLLAIGAILKNAGLSVRLVIVAAFITTLQVQRNVKEYPGERHYAHTHDRLLRDEHIKVGKIINENVPPDEWIAVHADAGAIPYHAGQRTLDFGGLNDEYLAREKPGPEETAEYFYSHNPGAVSFTSRKRNEVDHGEDADAIIRDPRFGNYKLVKTFSCNLRVYYHQFLYIRKDLLPIKTDIE